MPSKGGRAPSGPWGRLKPVEQDPLQSIGLPSKGDTRYARAVNMAPEGDPGFGATQGT